VVNSSIPPNACFRDDFLLQIKVRFAPIAQLDRVPDYESVGRVFESPWARKEINGLRKMSVTHFDCEPILSPLCPHKREYIV
jgi:hypothetical protein